MYVAVKCERTRSVGLGGYTSTQTPLLMVVVNMAAFPIASQDSTLGHI